METAVRGMLSTHPAGPGGVDTDALAHCIEECVASAQACTACADACLSEGMVADLAKCIRTDMDCADICTTTAAVRAAPTPAASASRSPTRTTTRPNRSSWTPCGPWSTGPTRSTVRPRPAYGSRSPALELEQARLPRDAFFGEADRVAAEDAVGRVAAETISPYPPGVPVVTPGEVITAEVVDHLRSGADHGMLVPDAADPTLKTFRVVAREPRS